MSNIRFIELSSYTKPEIKEVKNKDWVEYGDDNNYFGYLIDNYNGSPTNNAIINGIVQQIYGSGLDARDKARKPDQWASLLSMLSAEELRKAIIDLKVNGQCSFQAIYAKGKNRIEKLYHFPVDTLRAEKANEEGDIEGYYYCPDWKELKMKPRMKPERIPSFGFGGKSDLIEILYIKPYAPGAFYYAPVDYQGCLPYCDLEQEVANYHINNIRNGLAAGAIVNFNNGVPSDEKEKEKVEQAIKAKFSGTSNAGKFVLAFNDNKENAATIETLQLSEAHAQYSFLSEESTQKIMVGHRVTSPMLLGIKDSTGLGNNAEELKTASMLFEATVINPFRMLLIDGLEKVLSFNGMNLRLFFGSLNPFEQDTQEEAQQDTSLSDERPFLADDLAHEIIEQLEGLGESEEELLKDFEFIDSEIVDDEPEDFDAEEYLNSREDLSKVTALESFADYPEAVKNNAKRGIELNEKNGNKCATQVGKVRAQQLANGEAVSVDTIERMYSYLSRAEEYYDEGDTEACGTISYLLWGGKAGLRWAESKLKELDKIEMAAQQDSEQDSERYKVRYVYTKGTRKQPKGESRPLCRALVSAGKVYRKEDIQKLSSKGGAESKGKPYSVWMWKGGKNCYHRWERRVYRKKLNKNGEPWGGGALSGTKKISVNDAVRQGFKMPKNNKNVAIAPIEMPNKGAKN